MMSRLLFSFGLVIWVSGCWHSPGYLEEVPPPLAEKVFYPSGKSLLETVAQTTARVAELEEANLELKKHIRTAEERIAVLQQQKQELQQLLKTTDEQNGKMRQQLEMAEKLSQSQEEELLQLTIVKVRLEQEIVRLKIQLLKEEQGLQ